MAPAALGFVAVAAGITVRSVLPWGFWHKYLGVALWSVALYALIVFVHPRTRLASAAAVTLGISWLVELAQLTPGPAWLSARHVMLRMTFGSTFNAWDLPAYAAGVTLAALAHAGWRRCSPSLGGVTSRRSATAGR